MARALLAQGYKLRIDQYFQVLRDRWLGDLEMAGNLARGQLSILEQVQDFAAVIVCEDSKNLSSHNIILADTYISVN